MRYGESGGRESAGYVAAVGAEKAAERGDVHEALLEEEGADDGDADACEDIDDVVMEGVDGREPYAQTNEGEETAQPPGAAGAHGVDGGHEHIGGME